MCAMLGMEESEIIGLHRSDVVHTSEEEMAEMLKEREVTGKAKSEMQLKRKDGSILYGSIENNWKCWWKNDVRYNWNFILKIFLFYSLDR